MRSFPASIEPYNKLDMPGERVQAQADNPGVLVLPPLLFGVAALVVVALHWLLPLRIPAHHTAFWLGIVLLVTGGGIAAWGLRTMRAAGTNINPSLPTTALVIGGPFRFSRNPLYLALTLVFLGISFAIDTWWGVVVIVPVLLVLHHGVVLREERYLERKFGERYRQYQSMVRRYL